MDSAILITRCKEALIDISDRGQKRALMIDFLLAWRLIQSFRQSYAAISAEWGDPESPREYIPRRAVFIPRSLRWDEAELPVEALLSFLPYMEEQLPELRGVTQAELWASQVTDQQLWNLLKLYDDWKEAHEPTGDNCVELLEWILRDAPFEEREQRFLAPRQVAGLLVDMIRPEAGAVYDPCCGTGSFLAAAAKRMGDRKAFCLYGHEYSEQMWRVSKLLCCLWGYPAKLGQSPAYALACRPEELPKADFVIGNPPFHDIRWGQGERASDWDPRWKYGVPGKRGAALAWLQHMLYTLKDDGTMAVIMGVSSLSRVSANERGIRRGIVKDGLLEAVLLLPAGIFYGTQAPSSVWILRKGRDREAGALLIDARELGSRRDRQVVLEAPACQKILNAWQDFRRGGRPEEDGFCACAAQRQFEEMDWDLDPKRYIRYPREPLPDWEELARRDEALTRERRELLENNQELLQALLSGKEA